MSRCPNGLMHYQDGYSKNVLFVFGQCLEALAWVDAGSKCACFVPLPFYALRARPSIKRRPARSRMQGNFRLATAQTPPLQS